MFWVSPKETALDGWFPLAMRVRHFGGDSRCRPTLGVPLMEENYAGSPMAESDRSYLISWPQYRHSLDFAVSRATAMAYRRSSEIQGGPID
jgi:hypothetical protein